MYFARCSLGYFEFDLSTFLLHLPLSTSGRTCSHVLPTVAFGRWFGSIMLWQSPIEVLYTYRKQLHGL